MTKNGSALITVMYFITFSALIIATIAWVTSHSAFTVRKLYYASRALHISESGVADSLANLTSNYNGYVNASYSKTFNDGSYKVNNMLIDDCILITSIGSYQGVDVTTALEVISNKEILYNSILANLNILAGGNIELYSSALNITGGMHSNGDILTITGSPTINGDITAVGNICISVVPGSAIKANGNKIPIPDFSDYFDDWRQAAISGGIYYSGSTVFKGENLKPANGIVFVDGDVIVQNNTTLKGAIISTGSITVNNRPNQTPFAEGWPSLMALGNINLFNNNVYNGTIFSGNNITLMNNKNMTGKIIALNNIYMHNNLTVNPYYGFIYYTPSGLFDSSLIIGAWVQ